jgi:hypothetical protein
MKFYVIKIRVYSKEESVTHQEIETRVRIFDSYLGIEK